MLALNIVYDDEATDDLNVIPANVFRAALAERLEARRAQARPAQRRSVPTPVPAVATAAPAISWLVMLRCLTDAVPVGLFDDQGQAEQWAALVAADPLPHVVRYRKLAGMDPELWELATPVSVDVVEFAHSLPESVYMAGWSHRPAADNPAESRTFFAL